MTAHDSMDIEMIEKIRNGDESPLKKIYAETYPMVEQFVIKNSGSSEEARDIFQDAFYIFYEKIRDTEFNLTSKISTFLFGIARHKWLKELTKTKLNAGQYRTEQEYEDLLDENEEKLSRTKAIQQGLEELGDPCKTLLISFYYLKKTMQEIAQALNYTNAENAKNQKYKCLQRLKKIVTGTNG